MKKYKVKVNNKLFEVEVEEIVATAAVEKTEKETAPEVKPAVENKPAPENIEGEKVTAPLPGTISIEVKEGAQVNKGDVIFILEAMKMENEITAPTSGTVKAIYVTEGATVDTGELLAVIG